MKTAATALTASVILEPLSQGGCQTQLEGSYIVYSLIYNMFRPNQGQIANIVIFHENTVCFINSLALIQE
jgi:hypothetical protein